MTGPSKARPIRVHADIWEAYDRLCSRLGTTRAERINAHIRTDIETQGTQEERELLQRGLETMPERGRPRKHHPPQTPKQRAAPQLLEPPEQQAETLATLVGEGVITDDQAEILKNRLR